jgi:protein tyrosine/serine phosphatase
MKDQSNNDCKNKSGINRIIDCRSQEKQHRQDDLGEAIQILLINDIFTEIKTR